METRFKLTADGNVHIDHNGEAYADKLANALLDIAEAGLTITPPDLAAVSGAITVVGFEVSDLKKDFILDNGWHYPIPANLVADYQQYVDCIGHIPAINTAKETRLGEVVPAEGGGEPVAP